MIFKGNYIEVLYLQVKAHTHWYTDNMLQEDWCRSGWSPSNIHKGEWENNSGERDPNCEKSSKVSTTGGSETRPKNIRVIYIMKVR